MLSAMARDLKTDMEILRKVLDFAQNRDFQRAGALAEQTLASGFEHPMLLNVLATRLEQEDKFEDALRLLQRAVNISPGDIGARNALSMCLQRLDRPAEALLHADELLRRQPDLGFAHANRGNALIALGLLGPARLSHLRALELEPGNLAATVSLASIATHRGEHAEARGWADQALRAAPGLPDAVLSLAAAELAAGETTRAEQLLHQLIVDLRAGPSDKARASGLLGDVLDATRRYAEAFNAYSDSNEALRKIHGRFASGTSMLAYTQALSAAIESVSSPSVAPDTQESGTLGHVFLIGFPRSGTTLLEVVLDGHPNVASLEEHELLTDAVLRFMREPVSFEGLIRADENELRALRAAYWGRVRNAGIDVTGKVFIDKHPLNTLKLPLVARLFPRSKILFAFRDPRDVVFSCFRRRFKMNPAMYELLTLPGAAAFYDAVMEFADRARSRLNLDWRDMRYETLATDFEQETRAICGFLGLEWSAGMGDFAGRVQSRDHATPSTAQLARGLDRSGIDQWKNYRAQLEPILPTLHRWVERFGY
jgi:tetratricopeptide (TPR) repeat protein